MINYNEFTKELKSYYYDSLEDAAAAIYEDGVFDKVSNPHFKWGFIWNPSGVLY